MAQNIRSNVDGLGLGMEGKVTEEPEEGYDGAGAVTKCGDAEHHGGTRGLEEYFTFMDLNWRQFSRNHPNVSIPALQDIILASWKSNKPSFCSGSCDKCHTTTNTTKPCFKGFHTHKTPFKLP